MKHILILSTFLLTMNLLSASNTIEVKAEISRVDCSLENSTMYMDIFIKKAASASQDIYLEHQNYRFNFDAQSLLAGSFFIESEGDLLSGFNVTPDGSAYIFGAHHITGSNNNILSYNIEYQGGTAGLPLHEDWIRVGTIGATLLTNIECISSDILTSASFPSTNLVYKQSDLASSETIIDQEPIVHNLNSCLQSYCQLCSENLTLTQSQNNYTSGEILEHQVSDYIEATNIVGQDAQVTYNVKNQGILEAGFEVQSDAVFELNIEGCEE